MLRKHASERVDHFILLLNCWAGCQFLQGSIYIYYRQESKEVCLVIAHSGQLLGQPFQSQVAMWQAEVFSSECLSVSCSTQRQCSFTCRKDFFTGLHMNIVGASVNKANVNSRVASQLILLTVVNTQKWRVALDILTINGTEVKYLPYKSFSSQISLYLFWTSRKLHIHKKID